MQGRAWLPEVCHYAFANPCEVETRCSRSIMQVGVPNVVLMPAAADPGRLGGEGVACADQMPFVESHHVATGRTRAAIAGGRTVACPPFRSGPILHGHPHS